MCLRKKEYPSKGWGDWDICFCCSFSSGGPLLTLQHGVPPLENTSAQTSPTWVQSQACSSSHPALVWVPTGSQILPLSLLQHGLLSIGPDRLVLTSHGPLQASCSDVVSLQGLQVDLSSTMDCRGLQENLLWWLEQLLSPLLHWTWCQQRFSHIFSLISSAAMAVVQVFPHFWNTLCPIHCCWWAQPWPAVDLAWSWLALALSHMGEASGTFSWMPLLEPPTIKALPQEPNLLLNLTELCSCSRAGPPSSLPHLCILLTDVVPNHTYFLLVSKKSSRKKFKYASRKRNENELSSLTVASCQVLSSVATENHIIS